MSKSGISSVPDSAVNGNIGVSPIDSTAITRFSLGMDSTNEFSTSKQVNGEVLCQTDIVLKNLSSVNGRLLAQAAVTLDMSTVVAPD